MVRASVYLSRWWNEYEKFVGGITLAKVWLHSEVENKQQFALLHMVCKNCIYLNSCILVWVIQFVYGMDGSFFVDEDIRFYAMGNF